MIRQNPYRNAVTLGLLFAFMSLGAGCEGPELAVARANVAVLRAELAVVNEQIAATKEAGDLTEKEQHALDKIEAKSTEAQTVLAKLETLIVQLEQEQGNVAEQVRIGGETAIGFLPEPYRSIGSLVLAVALGIFGQKRGRKLERAEVTVPIVRAIETGRKANGDEGVLGTDANKDIVRTSMGGDVEKIVKDITNAL